jgi:hypothetical protein
MATEDPGKPACMCGEASLLHLVGLAGLEPATGRL